MADNGRIEMPKALERLVRQGQKCLGKLDGTVADQIATQAELICIANEAAKEAGMNDYNRMNSLVTLRDCPPEMLHGTSARLLRDMTGFDFSGGDKGEP